MMKKPPASQNQIEPRGLPPRVRFTATGLRLPLDLTEEEWKSTGEAFSALDQARDWAIGDWLNAGADHSYIKRGRYDEAEVLFPVRTRRRLRNLAYVARKVESSRRRDDSLDIGHHEEVAARPVDHQRRWLKRAPDEQMTVRGLRRAIAAERISGLTGFDRGYGGVGQNARCSMASPPRTKRRRFSIHRSPTRFR